MTRLVLPQQNFLYDWLVSVLALSAKLIVTGRQVGSEHLARGGTRTMAQNTSAEAAAVPTGPRREVLIILPGLLLAIMLAMLDQLVVSTALPRIVGDLGGVTHLSWVVTAYVLASTVTTPLYGKLGDLYGRKRLLIAAIIIFLIGSALSGLSHTMDQLIMFRALQGLGAGGLLVGAIAIIGDLAAPRERGQLTLHDTPPMPRP